MLDHPNDLSQHYILHPMSSVNQKQRGVALITVLFVMSLFLLLAIHMNKQSIVQSKLTTVNRLDTFYNTAAKSALKIAQTSLEDHFTASGRIEESSSDFDMSTINFGELLSSPIGDQWEERFGVDYKTHGQETLPGLSSYNSNTWSISLNNGRMIVPVRIFVKNNFDDPASAIAGNLLLEGTDQEFTATKNLDIDGKIVVTAIAFGTHNNEEPMSIVSAIVSPSPDYDSVGYSRPVGNQGFNNNSGWN